MSREKHEIIRIDFGPGPWGLYDPIDHCWLGDKKGPRIFDQLDFARIAASVTNKQLGYFNRIQVKTYDEEANSHKDDVLLLMSFEKALDRVERGR